MDFEKDKSERERLSDLYRLRFEKAKKGVGFHNCAGFVKYLIGLSEKETYIATSDPNASGLIKYLEQRAVLPFSEYSQEKYLEQVTKSDVVAILHNNNNRWTYLHFFVPNPDPRHPLEIFQRNGFEEEEAEITLIGNIIKDDEYAGDSSFVFFRKKK